MKDREAELLYFADVCAGPGGFSEYVLWRKKWHAKGFGMTLKGPNDFKLEDFYSASSELFEPYYGRDTEEGTRRYEGQPLYGDFRSEAVVIHITCFLSCLLPWASQILSESWFPLDYTFLPWACRIQVKHSLSRFSSRLY